MEKKLRHSRQRERIYEYLMASQEHPSAEMVYNDLRPEIPGLSLGCLVFNLSYAGALPLDFLVGSLAGGILPGFGTLRRLLRGPRPLPL